MSAGEFPGEAWPQATAGNRARPGWIAAMEAFEEMRAVGGRDRQAGVGDEVIEELGQVDPGQVQGEPAGVRLRLLQRAIDPPRQLARRVIGSSCRSPTCSMF